MVPLGGGRRGMAFYIIFVFFVMAKGGICGALGGEKTKTDCIFQFSANHGSEQVSVNSFYSYNFSKNDIGEKNKFIPALSSTEKSTKVNIYSRHASWIGYTPKSVDWRSKLGQTKDQLSCGSCSIFAVAASIEGAYSILNGLNLTISLSEKQILDCYGGCSGIWPRKLVENMMESRIGLALEKNYGRYTGEKGVCRVAKETVKVRSYEQIPAWNESYLLAAVSQQPVISHITLTDEFRGWSNYEIFQDSENRCTQGAHLTHVVTIVGYGTEYGIDYWIIRNSFGESWGSLGYARIKRGICGITTLPSIYPVLVSQGRNPCRPINPCGRGICSSTIKESYTCECPSNFEVVTNVDNTQTCAPAKQEISKLRRGNFDSENICIAMDIVRPYDFMENRSDTCQSIIERNPQIKPNDFFGMNADIDCENLTVNTEVCVGVQQNLPSAACKKYYTWQSGDTCNSVIKMFCDVRIRQTWIKCMGANAGSCVGTGSTWKPGRVVCVKSCLNYASRRVFKCVG